MAISDIGILIAKCNSTACVRGLSFAIDAPISGNNANTRGRKTQQGVERKYFSALCNRSKRLRCSLTPTIFGEQDTQKTYVAATCGRVPLPWCKTAMARPGNDVTSLKLQRASSAAFRHIAVLSSNQHDTISEPTTMTEIDSEAELHGDIFCWQQSRVSEVQMDMLHLLTPKRFSHIPVSGSLFILPPLLLQR